MQEFLIKNYINKLSKKELNDFAKKHGIELENDELELIENHKKNNWRTIIYGNPRPILDNLKQKLEQPKYQKIENLHIEFKNKYKNYL